MILIRIICFIGVAIMALMLPLWMFVCGAFAYAFAFSPYELLVLSMCIDAQFGDVGRGVWYMYTGAVAVVTILTLSVRPYLRFYL